jgi:Ser/Thr protein kinase RdoA (MazF antagonist)
VPGDKKRAGVAAAAVAAANGLDSRDAQVVAGSNNAIVLFPHARAVAKVGISDLRGPAAAALARELSVARHLSERKAPIVPPLPGEQAGPHEAEGFVLTLWSYCPSIAEPRNGASIAAAEALVEVHAVLADYPGRLPGVEDHLARAAALVSDKNATPALTDADRITLLAAYEAGAELLGERSGTARPLHGEPHARNYLWKADGPLLIDFEATCRGPLEWDVAYQPREARSVFPAARPELVRRCGLLVSFAVAAWCWTKTDRSPAVAEAARFHLERVRQARA